MPGTNCAFFGCGTSRNHGLSLFKIPSVRADDAEHTATLKRKTREEWLRAILRTREMEPEFKKRIETNNVFICELHFKPEYILTSKCLFCYLRAAHAEQRSFMNNATCIRVILNMFFDFRPETKGVSDWEYQDYYSQHECRFL